MKRKRNRKSLRADEFFQTVLPFRANLKESQVRVNFRPMGSHNESSVTRAAERGVSAQWPGNFWEPPYFQNILISQSLPFILAFPLLN